MDYFVDLEGLLDGIAKERIAHIMYIKLALRPQMNKSIQSVLHSSTIAQRSLVNRDRVANFHSFEGRFVHVCIRLGLSYFIFHI